jgi:nicotinamide-nucleotide amidase
MELIDLAEAVGERFSKRGLMLATAESCTGGWIAQIVTAVSGSSVWFERGFVTYSNAAKQEMLGVTALTLAQYGAVSEETVKEMAQGAIQHSHAQVSVAVSGVAGPGGGSLEKPVGTVCFGWVRRGAEASSCKQHFEGDREAVRRQAVAFALQGVLDLVNDD